MPKIVQLLEAEARPNKGKKRAGVTGCHRIAGLSARLGDEGETAIKNREPNVRFGSKADNRGRHLNVR
jgi:hypothetical protein